MSCYCDATAPSAFWVETPKARKDHRCCECRGTISAGEGYIKYSGIWDGERASYKTCSDCDALAKWWQSLVPCFCRSFGDLFETIYNDAAEYECSVSGTLEEVAEKMDAIRAERGAKPLGYVSAARKLAEDQRANAEKA